MKMRNKWPQRKNQKTIIGLMSGTSADGIDAVVVNVKGNGISTRYKQIVFATYPYPKGFRDFLLKNSNSRSARLDSITRLNVLIGILFGKAAKNIAGKAGIDLKKIDLIGSHGQTICHVPASVSLFSKKIRGTLQIGHPCVIAKITGIPTVGDFRIADIAVGGSGAPLVPLFDFFTFRSAVKNRLVLNIGGISNITVLPKACRTNSILAYDTGPGNMIIDSLMKRLFGKSIDKNGKTASSGKIIPSLLQWMMRHNYLRRIPPKSTGREMFGDDYISEILKHCRNENKNNIITTVTEFTPLTVYDSYVRFIRQRMIPDELIVSGGGTHNSFIMEALRRYFCGLPVLSTDERNVSSDAKEAICFALLANETIHGNSGNITGATGAERETILGSICLP